MTMEKNKDRLSELPDPILHIIFSSLPTKQAVQASLLSKRWSKFWVSMTNLSFHLNKTRPGPSIHYFDTFMYYRDRQQRRLSPTELPHGQNQQRRNSFSIERLHLHLWNFGPIRLDHCLHTAIMYNNVREIDITLDAYGPCLRIPEPLFTSSPICEFRLKNLKSPITDLAVELPESLLWAAHLNTLELVHVELPYLPNLQEKVVLRCPVLEILILVGCFFRSDRFLSISTPQLKKLVMDNDIIVDYHQDESFEDEDDYFKDVEIELDTLNLSSFVYKGGFSGYFHSLGTLSKLVSAEICASLGEDAEEDLEGTAAVNVLNCLRNASNLALESFEDFPPEVTNLLGEALTSFINLKTLELRTTKIDDVGFLLTKCASIETLVLLLPEWYIFQSEKNEKLVLPQQCSLNKLKYVAVKGVIGLDRELAFLRFLLDNAPALERMTITGYPLESDDHRKAQMTLFGFKLLKLSHNFSTVKLSYKIL